MQGRRKARLGYECFGVISASLDLWNLWVAYFVSLLLLALSSSLFSSLHSFLPFSLFSVLGMEMPKLLKEK